MYDNFRTQLTNWGYTVTRNTGPVADISDADVIVILPEDGYTSGSLAYDSTEAAWFQSFVDNGGGLFISVCPNNTYWLRIAEIMTLFGITEGEHSISSPNVLDDLHHELLFYNVTEIGSSFSYSTDLVVSSPSVSIAGNGTYDGMALYTGTSIPGFALWFTPYMMLRNEDVAAYDNPAFLANAFELLSSGSVATESTSWGGLKALFR
mgnify:CR=1 FL=1